MRLIPLLILLIPAAACAQYKCTINGKTQYSDHPCAADARYVGALEDNVSERARIDAELIRRGEKIQRNNLERRENETFRGQQRAIENQISAEHAQQVAADQAKKSRCANLEYEIRSNQRGVARYQDFGWQRSLTQQEIELKRNREAYERDCR